MPQTATSLTASLVSIVDARHVLSAPSELAAYAVDEVTPRVAVKPATAEQAAEIVKFALREKLAIMPVGGRSKLAIGNPLARYDIALDMTAPNQIAHYDPGDLTLSVDAGCTLQTIANALTPQKQFLPLPLTYGTQCTVGGTIASGVDSPLRQSYGTARDFLVGAEFIDGTGAQVKSGGRVVKNVTGYDLHKLLIGSLGTLGIITRLNFRTFPAMVTAESQSGTFCAAFADATAAVAFRQKIAASPFTPDAVEIFSPEFAKIVATNDLGAGNPPFDNSGARFSPENWHVVVQYHGAAEVCARYEAALLQYASDAGAKSGAKSNAKSGANSGAEWGFEPHGAAHTLSTFAQHAPRYLHDASPAAAIFKIAQLPAKLPELFSSLAAIANQAQIPHALFAHGLGITYFALLPRGLSPHAAPPPLAASVATQSTAQLTAQLTAQPNTSLSEQTIAQLQHAATRIFATCAASSATAQIQFAPTPVKRQLSMLGPERPDFTAMRRLKLAFDPQAIFSPGRLLEPHL